MAVSTQKELANGGVRYQPGEQVPNVEQKLWALRNQCTDCKICETVCSLIHSPDGEMNPRWTRIKIAHAPQVKRQAGKDGFGYIARICEHCGNPPPCAKVCPTDAFYYDPITLAAIIDQVKCIQCMECVPACPFDAVFVAPSGEVLKCDLCGGDPACVKACATRPEMSNAGKQYNRSSVLFFENKAAFNAFVRQEPEARDEMGMMQAMLEKGKISSSA